MQPIHKKIDAVLAVSFGTCNPQARRQDIEPVEDALRARYPDTLFYRAFTSPTIRRKLEREQGVLVDDAAQALARAAQDGAACVLVQPTFVINGYEQERLRGVARAFAGRFEALHVGAPLLSSAQDYQTVACMLARDHPFEQDRAVLLAGHGSAHEAGCAYAALGYWLWAQGRRDLLVGAVEGSPTLAQQIGQLEAQGARRVLLRPLLLTAGEHARRDMAGDEPDSWRAALARAGFEVAYTLEGLGGSGWARALYVQHADEALLVVQNNA